MITGAIQGLVLVVVMFLVFGLLKLFNKGVEKFKNRKKT